MQALSASRKHPLLCSIGVYFDRSGPPISVCFWCGATSWSSSSRFVPVASRCNTFGLVLLCSPDTQDFSLTFQTRLDTRPRVRRVIVSMCRYSSSRTASGLCLLMSASCSLPYDHVNAYPLALTTHTEFLAVYKLNMSRNMTIAIAGLLALGGL